MTGTLNKVMLIGHTGDDVKMHYFEGGGSVGRFPLATNEVYTNKTTGQKVENTEWHNIVVRNKAAEICEKYLKKTLPIALGAGFICFVFDFIMEPVAIRFDYWTWSGDKIPLQNYIAWFSIAFLAALLYRFLKVRIRSAVPKHFVIVQFIFFSMLNLGTTLWV